MVLYKKKFLFFLTAKNAKIAQRKTKSKNQYFAALYFYFATFAQNLFNSKSQRSIPNFSLSFISDQPH